MNEEQEKDVTVQEDVEPARSRNRTWVAFVAAMVVLSGVATASVVAGNDESKRMLSEAKGAVTSYLGLADGSECASKAMADNDGSCRNKAKRTAQKGIGETRVQLAAKGDVAVAASSEAEAKGCCKAKAASSEAETKSSCDKAKAASSEGEAKACDKAKASCDKAKAASSEGECPSKAKAACPKSKAASSTV
jgi:hypothetical protein